VSLVVRLFDTVDDTGVPAVTYPFKSHHTEKGWMRNGRIYNLSQPQMR